MLHIHALTLTHTHAHTLIHTHAHIFAHIRSHMYSYAHIHAYTTQWHTPVYSCPYGHMLKTRDSPGWLPAFWKSHIITSKLRWLCLPWFLCFERWFSEWPRHFRDSSMSVATGLEWRSGSKFFHARRWNENPRWEKSKRKEPGND